MEEAIAIFVDAGNFYHLVLKKMGLQEIDFDYDAFVAHLLGDRILAERGKRFYTGTVREIEGDERSKKQMSRQNALFSRLTSTGWVRKTSKLRRREETLVIDGRVERAADLHRIGIHEIKHVKHREKGIDVQLAVDLIVGAMDDCFSSAVIVSSDTDLVPAITILRERFKRPVEYIGFSIADPSGEPDKATKPTATLIYRTDRQRTFVESDLRPFVLPKIEELPLPLQKSEDDPRK